MDSYCQADGGESVHNETNSQNKSDLHEKETGVQLHRDGGTKRGQFVCNSMSSMAQQE